jgi:hypothetical protein
MAEALEKWPIEIFSRLLPRIYNIVEEINRRFCLDIEQVALLPCGKRGGLQLRLLPSLGMSRRRDRQEPAQERETPGCEAMTIGFLHHEL